MQEPSSPGRARFAEECFVVVEVADELFGVRFEFTRKESAHAAAEHLLLFGERTQFAVATQVVHFFCSVSYACSGHEPARVEIVDFA